MRPARCLGVYASGVANRCPGVAGSEAPQPLQNRLSGGLVCPHAAQAMPSRLPQALQNFAPEELSCWQCEHRIAAHPPGGTRLRGGASRRVALRIPSRQIKSAADALLVYK